MEEGTAELTAVPHAVLGHQGHNATASPGLPLGHQHVTGESETAQPGPGESWEAGLPGWGCLGTPPLLTLVQLLSPFWELPLISPGFIRSPG